MKGEENQIAAKCERNRERMREGGRVEIYIYRQGGQIEI